jgi:membrane associated rhomboid family serine protease
MVTSIFDDIKNGFRLGNNLLRLIYFIGGVFLFFILLKIIGMMTNGGYNPPWYDFLFNSFRLNGDINYWIYRPWTLITYAFLHSGFLHLIFNLLILYWFGVILADLIGEKRLLPYFFIGTLVGGLVFSLAFHFLPPGFNQGQFLIGSSAGAMALMFAAATITPDYTLHLIILGPVKLKWIACVYFIIDLSAISMASNTGGAISHIGAALSGILLIKGLQAGYDLPNWLYDILNLKLPRKSNKIKSKIVSINSKTKEDFNQETKLNFILEKVRQKGYESLSQAEKDFLKYYKA